MRARLLREPDLTLTKAIKTCRATELSKSQLQNIVETHDKHMRALYAKKAATKPRKATSRKITLLVEYKDKFYPAEFQVTAQEEVMPVLGLPTCLDMALVKRIYAVNSSDDKPFSKAEPQESHDNSSDDKDQKPASAKIMERYADVFSRSRVP